MPGWLSQFYGGIPQQYAQLGQQMGQQGQSPLYGPAQQANFQQGLNQQYGAAQNNILSQLASRGALNSGRAAEVQTGLGLGEAAQMGNYMAQTPLLNAQFRQSALGQQGNLLANAAGYRPPVVGQQTAQSQTTQQIQDFINQVLGSSQSSGTSSGTQTQQQTGGLLQSLLGGLLNAGMGALTGGLGNMFGGQAANPVTTLPANYNQQAAPFMPPQAPTTYPWSQGGAGAPPNIFGYGAM